LPVGGFSLQPVEPEATPFDEPSFSLTVASPLTPLEHAARTPSTGCISASASGVVDRRVDRDRSMLLVPLTVKQIHSMQSLQRHAPQMKEIQKKYKQDKQKRTKS
jgi:hypothetical protein